MQICSFHAEMKHFCCCCRWGQVFRLGIPSQLALQATGAEFTAASSTLDQALPPPAPLSVPGFWIDKGLCLHIFILCLTVKDVMG